MSLRLDEREPVGRKELPAMAQKSRRPYGTGCILVEGRGFAIRWYEDIIGSDGKPQRVKRYEALGPVSRKKAAETLATKLRTSAPEFCGQCLCCFFPRYRTKCFVSLHPLRFAIRPDNVFVPADRKTTPFHENAASSVWP